MVSNNDLSPVLFWDTDSAVDWERDAEWLIERVVEMGTLDDFCRILGVYGREKVQTVLLQSGRLSDRDLHFCSIYFGIEKSKFACYTKKSLKDKPLRYWNP